jgi:transcription initiation factor TFIIIB Brf1 subunit/transcription initiation factor TFIIB
MKDSIIRTERFMLKELGFIVQAAHPHKYLLHFIKIIEGSAEMAQKAWSYLNDSLRTIVVVRFPPHVITVSCIYLAARAMQIPLPEKPSPWWQLFDVKWKGIHHKILTNISH